MLLVAKAPALCHGSSRRGQRCSLRIRLAPRKGLINALDPGASSSGEAVKTSESTDRKLRRQDAFKQKGFSGRKPNDASSSDAAGPPDDNQPLGRGQVLQACAQFNLKLSGFGLLLMAVQPLLYDATHPEAWTSIPATLEPPSQVAVAVAAGLLVTLCRIGLLQVWPAFKSSTDQANSQVRSYSEHADWTCMHFEGGAAVFGATGPLLGCSARPTQQARCCACAKIAQPLTLSHLHSATALMPGAGRAGASNRTSHVAGGHHCHRLLASSRRGGPVSGGLGGSTGVDDASGRSLWGCVWGAACDRGPQLRVGSVCNQRGHSVRHCLPADGILIGGHARSLRRERVVCCRLAAR